MDTQLLPRHPIRVVAQRTGLTPATIRAWERRYDAVSPSRSEGRQRLYSDRDVERLRTLKQLTGAGRSISMVAELSDQEAAALLSEDRTASVDASLSVSQERPRSWVEECYGCVKSLDADGLERTLWRAVMTLGGRAFLSEVVAELLHRIGVGWAEGEITPGQEHLGSEVLDRVLERLAERSRTAEGPTLVVATLPGERHGLGARLVSVAAVFERWHVVHLGTDLPVVDIAATAESVRASAVAISVVGRDDEAGTVASLTRLRELLDPVVAVFVGGRGAQPIADRLPSGVTVFDGLSGLEAPPAYPRASGGL